MPRILLSAAHIVPKVLESLNFEHKPPALVNDYPPLPGPFHSTPQRVASLIQTVDVDAMAKEYKEKCEIAAARPYCNDERSRPKI